MTGQAFAESNDWDLEIKPGSKTGSSPLQIYAYKDLLLILVRRDYLAIFKQTLLGPLWLLLQPLAKVAVFYLVFDKLAGISTDGIPSLLFYLSGLTFWEFFASNVKKTSDTFVANQHIFGKVYFPRIIVPLAMVLSNGVRLSVQFALFIVVWLYYLWTGAVNTGLYLLLLPAFLLIIAVLSLGIGLLLSSVSARYRDLRFAIDAFIQVVFFISPVIYPVSIAGEKGRDLLFLNPMAPVLEALRFIFLGKGVVDIPFLLYSTVFAALVFWMGSQLFSRTSRNVMDTV